MRRRHAEIVGGGLAGLSAAVALAQRDWSVRLHERHASLRREGFGITVHANGLRVLAALGAREEATRDGVQLGFSELRDASNAVIARTKLDARACRLSRFRLVAALADRAKAAGVEIRLGSAAIAATPDGTVIFEDGSRRSADLVVAADGINSPLRNSLGLTRSQTLLPDGAQRMTILRQAETIGARRTPTRWSSGGPEPAASSTAPAARRISTWRCPAGAMTPVPSRCRSIWKPGPGPFRQLAGLFRRIHRDADPTTTLWAPFTLIKLEALVGRPRRRHRRCGARHAAKSRPGR